MECLFKEATTMGGVTCVITCFGGGMPAKEATDQEGVQALREREFAGERQRLETLFPQIDLSAWG